MTFRRLLLPVLLICLLAASLGSAATAAAQKKGGEATSPPDLTLPGEVDLLHGTALYDSTTGAATFTLRLREALGTNTEKEPPTVEYGGALLSSNAPCTVAGLEEDLKAGHGYPIFQVVGFNQAGNPGQLESASIYLTEPPSEPAAPPNYGPATNSVQGTTITLSASDSRAQNGLFTCVEIVAVQPEESEVRDLLVFPLTAPSEPPPVVTPSAPPVPTPAAPAAFSFAKAKPLELKADGWTPVRIKVTNTGGTATGPGSLRLKLPRGLKVRPVSARQRIPAIQPGHSWTVAFRVKPTEKAKPKSTISFIAAAGALTARGSLVVKLTGP